MKTENELVAEYKEIFDSLEVDGIHDYEKHFPNNKPKLEKLKQLSAEIYERFPLAYNNRIWNCKF